MDEDEEIAEREKMLFEDPRERPRTGATVLRLDSERLDIEVFPRILINRLGLIKSEATKLCQLESGILVDNIEPELAEALAEDLRAQGQECIVVHAAQIMMLPRPYPVHAMHFSARGMMVRGATEDWAEVGWSELAVLVLGQVAFEEERRQSTDSVLTRRISTIGTYGGIVGVAAAAAAAPKGRSTTVKSSSLHQILDLVTGDGRAYYRVDARHFDYSILGDQLQTSSVGNIMTLARWLLTYAPQVRTNVDAEALKHSGKVRLPSHSLHGMAEVAKWLMNLRRFGR